MKRNVEMDEITLVQPPMPIVVSDKPVGYLIEISHGGVYDNELSVASARARHHSKDPSITRVAVISAQDIPGDLDLPNADQIFFTQFCSISGNLTASDSRIITHNSLGVRGSLSATSFNGTLVTACSISVNRLLARKVNCTNGDLQLGKKGTVYGGQGACGITARSITTKGWSSGCDKNKQAILYIPAEMPDFIRCTEPLDVCVRVIGQAIPAAVNHCSDCPDSDSPHCDGCG